MFRTDKWPKTTWISDNNLKRCEQWKKKSKTTKPAETTPDNLQNLSNRTQPWTDIKKWNTINTEHQNNPKHQWGKSNLNQFKTYSNKLLQPKRNENILRPLKTWNNANMLKSEHPGQSKRPKRPRQSIQNIREQQLSDFNNRSVQYNLNYVTQPTTWTNSRKCFAKKLKTTLNRFKNTLEQPNTTKTSTINLEKQNNLGNEETLEQLSKKNRQDKEKRKNNSKQPKTMKNKLTQHNTTEHKPQQTNTTQHDPTQPKTK